MTPTAVGRVHCLPTSISSLPAFTPKPPATDALLREMIDSHFYFHSLSADQRVRLVNAAFPVRFVTHQAIVHADDAIDRIYLIEEGVAVEYGSGPVTHLTRGHFVGDVAMLQNAATHSTITVRETVKAWAISRYQIQAIVSGQPTITNSMEASQLPIFAEPLLKELQRRLQVALKSDAKTPSFNLKPGARMRLSAVSFEKNHHKMKTQLGVHSTMHELDALLWCNSLRSTTVGLLRIDEGMQLLDWMCKQSAAVDTKKMVTVPPSAGWVARALKMRAESATDDIQVRYTLAVNGIIVAFRSSQCSLVSIRIRPDVSYCILSCP